MLRNLLRRIGPLRAAAHAFYRTRATWRDRRALHADGFGGRYLLLGRHSPAPEDEFVDFDLEISPAEPGYEQSKLYLSTARHADYSEAAAICFRVGAASQSESIRLKLPDWAIGAGQLHLRLDALPHTRGTAKVGPVRFVPRGDDTMASRKARLRHLKQETRAAVLVSEAQDATRLSHQPESISLELTAGCNLTCAHCSSHGTAEAHGMNNRRAAFSIDMLDRLAAETFPGLTLVNLVGRGEPMMVGMPLWSRLIDHLEHNDVMMTCVSNGTFFRRRLDQRVLSVLDTLTVSIDGISPQVFAANRGGASLSQWQDNVAYFNQLRDAAPLARRPRLGLSWTLKRNNIHEFPGFVEMAIRNRADLLYVRHLFVFHEKDRGESLVDAPELANRYLREGYALLRGTAMKLDAALLAAVPG